MLGLEGKVVQAGLLAKTGDRIFTITLTISTGERPSGAVEGSPEPAMEGMKRSESTSITSIAFSLRSMRITGHSWGNSSFTSAQTPSVYRDHAVAPPADSLDPIMMPPEQKNRAARTAYRCSLVGAEVWGASGFRTYGPCRISTGRRRNSDSFNRLRQSRPVPPHGLPPRGWRPAGAPARPACARPGARSQSGRASAPARCRR